MNLPKDRTSRAFVAKLVCVVSMMLAAFCWWLAPAAQTEPSPAARDGDVPQVSAASDATPDPTYGGRDNPGGTASPSMEITGARIEFFVPDFNNGLGVDEAYSEIDDMAMRNGPIGSNAVVFSVDVGAEGLLQPDPGHLAPNDVFALGTAGGQSFLTEGELFQSSGATLGNGPDQTNVDRMSAALGIGPAPGGGPPYMGPFAPNTGAPNPVPNPPTGPGTLGLAPGDNIDALSFGRDGGSVLLFSVDPSSTGNPTTAVYGQAVTSPTAACASAATPSNGGGDPGEEAAGDIFVSAWIGGSFGGGMSLGPLPPQPLGMNALWLDEWWLGLQAPAVACSANGAPEDDLDALEVSDAAVVDADMDGDPDGGGAFVFFSLSATSPTIGIDDPFPGLCTASDAFAAGGDGVTPDDILISPPPGVATPPYAFAIYASGVQDIGLQSGDVIDALVLYDTGGPGGAPDGILTSGQDTALYSLTTGSPSLSPPLYGSDVLLTTFDGVFPPTAGFSHVWLGLTSTDELNALDIGWWFPPSHGPINRELFPDSLAKITVDATATGLGKETITLQGPVNVEVDLTTLADADSNGLEEVSTEMTGLDLTGNSALWGPVTVILNPAYYTDGQIEETVNNIRGVLEIPPFTSDGFATSYFDVYYEIEVSGETFYNPTPAHMATPRISRKRPRRRDRGYKDPYLIEVNRPDGTPASIYIGDETHHPQPPPPDPHGPGPIIWMDFDIPADFFDPGSDPWTGHIDLQGVPVNLFTQGDAATLFQRWGVPISPDAPVGSNGTVDLEIIELDLVSIAPITVTHSGVDPQDWNVAVGLSEVQSTVEVGTLTATKTHENGGTFHTWLEVQPRLTFTKVDNPEEKRVLDAGLEERPPLVFTSTNTPWVHEVNPELGILTPDDGLFVPMVEETVPGDPFSQATVEMTAVSTNGLAQHMMRPAVAVDFCVTLEQCAEYVDCLEQGGPDMPVPQDCYSWDANDSGHVDLGDFALIQKYICLPPPGDDCDDPILVSLPDEIPYMDSNTTCGRVDDYSETCLGPYDGDEDIIYELTVTDSIDVDIMLDPMGIPWTGIAIDSVCPPGDPCMAYSTNSLADPHGIECLHLDPGVYYVMIDIWPDPDYCYDFILTIEQSVSPANDDCTNAELISDVVNQPFDTTCATYDGPGFCMSGPDIWYCYEATCTGDVTVSLCGSSYDTVLGIYHTCACDPIGPMINCNDNFCGLQSQITFSAPMGETYLIEVGSPSMETGEGVLTIFCEPTPP